MSVWPRCLNGSIHARKIHCAFRYDWCISLGNTSNDGSKMSWLISYDMKCYCISSDWASESSWSDIRFGFTAAGKKTIVCWLYFYEQDELITLHYFSAFLNNSQPAIRVRHYSFFIIYLPKTGFYMFRLIIVRVV